ncbi:MAG TPA: alcohol dehydrogenase catalytic domain-containing protein [Thermodesulfovibrionales bacterium]|jgi:L-iditol 2-dehydrogenase|nr:alcohol dehydrogenase catalytic domain-containing protein [Thermodesulfovibrionales bacterium]
MMLAGILVKPGVIELRETEVPKPSQGELLVKIKAALTCGTDLKAFRRGHPVIPMPGLFGHEFSGIVTEVGRGITRFKKGDAIMAVHSAPCLSCRYCRKELYNLCENIMHTKILGAFAEYILLPPHIVRQNVLHKPQNLSFEEAAFLEPLSCVVHGMESLSVKKNDHALIIGSGPVGLLHLLLLKEQGVQVTVMDKHDSKLKVATKLGADHGMLSKIQNLTHDPGFDYVFECTGMPDVWEASVNYVRRGGTVVLFGGCKSGTTVTYDTERLHYDEITLKGVFHYTPADVKKAYKLLCNKNLNISRLISGRFPLKQTQKAFEKLSKGVGIKYAIIP